MPGRIVKVMVGEGDDVTDGQVVIVLEAMKMEHTLRAPYDGVVRSMTAAPGVQVEAGTVLAVVEPRT
jgi:propionyl-CoA carboxylase alpha chain